MQGDILAQGVELMIYGMGTVVVFLALLVVVTLAMSAFVSRYFPEPVVPPAPVRGKVSPGDNPAPNAEVLAAITAAIHQHRSKRQ